MAATAPLLERRTARNGLNDLLAALRTGFGPVGRTSAQTSLRGRCALPKIFGNSSHPTTNVDFVRCGRWPKVALTKHATT